MGYNTTIKVTKRTKAALDRLKVHRREPYEDVIKRLIAGRKEHAET